MKKAALFPFDRKMLPIVRHFRNMQDKYELTELIAMPGVGVGGRDAAAVCNQPLLGIQVSDKLDMGSSKWDILILNQEYLPTEFNEQELVMEILSCGKELVVLAHRRTSFAQWLAELSEEEKRIQLVSSDEFWEKEFQTTGYGAIQTPILLVGGLVEEADVLEVTVAVTKMLKDRGHSVVTMTKETVATMFGFLDYDPLYTKEGNESEIIFELNRMLQRIEKEFIPDIIVIEAPDALMRYNDLVPNGFGIRTYMLCQSALIDSILCCVPYELAQPKFIQSLDQDFSIRYGTGIGMVHASNILVDAVDMLGKRKMSFFYDNCDRMDNFIRENTVESDMLVSNVITQTEQFGMYLQKLLENEGDADE